MPRPETMGVEAKRGGSGGAPTLDAIITIKLGKGLLFALIALGFYTLSDNNLQWEFQHLLEFMHIDGSRKVFLDLGAKLARVHEATVLWVAAGTLVYGLLCLAEGIGLILRLTWAAWLAIAESALLIPFEVGELTVSFSWTLVIILAVNVTIVWYLLVNRKRMFHRHRRATEP